MIAEIEKFRVPNKAYVRPKGSRFKARWHNIYKSNKGYYIVLRGFRIYQDDWVYMK